MHSHRFQVGPAHQPSLRLPLCRLFPPFPAMPFSSVSVSLDPTLFLLPAACRFGGPRPPTTRLRRLVLRAASVSAVAEESSAAAVARGRLESLSQVAGVLGTQWGDEGKGKLVDILAQRFDVVARCQVSLSRALLICCSMLPFSSPDGVR